MHGEWRFRGHLAAIVALYVFDALMFDQGFLTAVVALVMLLPGALHVGLGLFEDRARARHGFRMIAGYVAVAVAVIATVRINEGIARARGERIVAALELYKAKHGAYPERLQELVPEYLPAVPLAKYNLVFNQFQYWYHADEDDGFLMYPTLSFARHLYRLKTAQWSFMG